MHRVTTLLACLGILVAAPNYHTHAAQPAGQAVIANAQFVERLTPEEAVGVVADHGGHVLELRHSYRSGTETWTGGFFVPADQRGAAEIAAAYRREHAVTIADLRAQQVRLEAAHSQDRRLAERGASLARAQEAFEGGPVVFAVQVAMPAEKLAELRGDPRVLAANEVRPRTSRKATAGAQAAPLSSHLLRISWVPDEIIVSVQPSNVSGRYVSQDMNWYSGRSLGWISDYDAFEADFFLSNNNGTYLTTAENFGRIPAVITWNTNLPFGYFGNPPYLDTRSGDSGDEWAYTIGTPGAKYIAVGSWYNTYIRADPGSASTDNGRISPQYGQCAAAPCDTWSVFAHDTCWSTWSIPIPAWQWTWTRTGGPYPCT